MEYLRQRQRAKVLSELRGKRDKLQNGELYIGVKACAPQALTHSEPPNDFQAHGDAVVSGAPGPFCPTLGRRRVSLMAVPGPAGGWRWRSDMQQSKEHRTLGGRGREGRP
jgi:hypothetical protein